MYYTQHKSSLRGSRRKCGANDLTLDLSVSHRARPGKSGMQARGLRLTAREHRRPRRRAAMPNRQLPGWVTPASGIPSRKPKSCCALVSLSLFLPNAEGARLKIEMGRKRVAMPENQGTRSTSASPHPQSSTLVPSSPKFGLVPAASVRRRLRKKRRATLSDNAHGRVLFSCLLTFCITSKSGFRVR